MYIKCKFNGERNENEAKAAAARTDISLFRDINGGNWYSLSRLLSPIIDQEVIAAFCNLPVPQSPATNLSWPIRRPDSPKP